MGLLLATLAALRPHDEWYDDGYLKGGSAVVVCALVFAYKFISDRIRDRRAHEGVSLAKRKRVRESGVAASARVLSVSELEEQASGGTHYYSIVYEVAAHEGGEAFRAKGIEELFTEDQVAVGETVAVRYDRKDRTIVLADPDGRRRGREQREAEQDRQLEIRAQEHKRALKELEARLLRGDPPK